jgi:hypothetical protein
MEGAESLESADLPIGDVPVEKDTLQIYGFSFEFPKDRKLEFNPKFKRTDGDVAVKAPDKAVVFVSWGELEKVMKKAPTIEKHAEFSLERVKKSVQGKMNSLDHKEVDVNGHRAAYNQVKILVPRRGLFGKGSEQQVTSVHVHCEKSGRYFVIYATSTEQNAPEQIRTLQGIMETLRCH